MRTFQIWGNFAPDDTDLEHPSTFSCFEKGLRMGPDGAGELMEDFERRFAEEDGERFILLHEFEPAPGVWLSEAAEREISGQVFRAFQQAWWHLPFDRNEVTSDEETVPEGETIQ